MIIIIYRGLNRYPHCKKIKKSYILLFKNSELFWGGVNVVCKLKNSIFSLRWVEVHLSVNQRFLQKKKFLHWKHPIIKNIFVQFFLTIHTKSTYLRLDLCPPKLHLSQTLEICIGKPLLETWEPGNRVETLFGSVTTQPELHLTQTLCVK
jgi:hypothetical protein